MGDSRISLAIAGVGNCASSLVQAVTAASGEALGPSGVPHERVGGYRVGDISFVAAFDVDNRKVGRDLADAITAPPNCTTSYIDVPPLGVEVLAGRLEDGVGASLAATVDVVDGASTVKVDEIAAALKAANAEVLVCYLPTGAARATEIYAEAAILAGAAFVNCNPERIATDRVWQARFAEAGLPVLGDDIRSQLGATRVHRVLLELCRNVGATVNRTYQMNFGGNTDFLNMWDPARASSKRQSKQIAVRELLPETAALSAGPSGYVDFLDDHKVAYIRVEGDLLLGMPFSMELRLEVEDSPNSAGVVLDAIRAARTALDRGRAGQVDEVCPYLFKHPPVGCRDSLADERFEAFAIDEEIVP